MLVRACLSCKTGCQCFLILAVLTPCSLVGHPGPDYLMVQITPNISSHSVSTVLSYCEGGGCVVLRVSHFARAHLCLCIREGRQRTTSSSHCLSAAIFPTMPSFLPAMVSSCFLGLLDRIRERFGSGCASSPLWARWHRLLCPQNILAIALWAGGFVPNLPQVTPLVARVAAYGNELSFC